jgi:hypothetical protein
MTERYVYQQMKMQEPATEDTHIARKIDVEAMIAESITQPNYGGKFYGIHNIILDIVPEGYDIGDAIIVPKYTVGASNLFVYRAGLLLVLGTDYNEIGQPNGISTVIEFNIRLEPIDQVNIIILKLSPDINIGEDTDPIDDPDWAKDVGTLINPKRLDLYVNKSTGKASNDGLTSTTPKSAFYELFSIITAITEYVDVFIHFSEDTHTGTNNNMFTLIDLYKSTGNSTINLYVPMNVRLRFIGEGQDKTIFSFTATSSVPVIQNLPRPDHIIFESLTCHHIQITYSNISFFNVKLVKLASHYSTTAILLVNNGTVKLHNVMVLNSFVNTNLYFINITNTVLYMSGDMLLSSTTSSYGGCIQSAASEMYWRNAHIEMFFTGGTYAVVIASPVAWHVDSCVWIVSSSTNAFIYFTGVLDNINDNYPRVQLKDVELDVTYLGPVNSNSFILTITDSGKTSVIWMHLASLKLSGNTLKNWHQNTGGSAMEMYFTIAGDRDVSPEPINKIQIVAGFLYNLYTHGQGLNVFPGVTVNTATTNTIVLKD